MKKEKIAGILAGSYGAGALTMYLLDPQRGKRRRAELRDSWIHTKSETAKFIGRFGRDLANRAEGAMAGAQHIFQHEAPSDYVLEKRVHSALGRVLSHPSAVEVSATNGTVFLTGWILADEADDVDKVVASVEGVNDFTSYLHTTDRPEHIPALQGGVPRGHVPEFLQQRWSPTSRVLAACAGAGLAVYGRYRWGSVKNPATAAGFALLLRSALNRPWAAVAGIDKTMGIRIQKAIFVSANANELYQFWNNPENYPKALPHVREVVRLEDDLYQWQLLGLGGVPLQWTGRIVRRIPEKLIEWKSVPGAAVENHGVVHLEPAKDGQTRLQIQMSYQPPAGLLGHAFAVLLGLDPKSLLDQDLIPLKALFESGETRVHGRHVKKSDLASSAAS